MVRSHLGSSRRENQVKTALITSITGQVARLAELLLVESYAVHGLMRQLSLVPEHVTPRIPTNRMSLRVHGGNLSPIAPRSPAGYDGYGPTKTTTCRRTPVAISFRGT
jgi:hypothetical protein